MSHQGQATYPELTAAAADWRFQPPAECLKQQNFVVTGAGAGIGAAIARAIACFGGNVVLLGRTVAKLEEVFDWIEANTKTRPVIVPCDLEQLTEDAANILRDSIRETYGVLHGLINNASRLGPKVPLAHYPVEEWQRVMQTNANAPFILTQGLFELLDQPKRASVINISSSVGREGRAYWGAYSASKFALEGFTQILADETDEAGRIRVYSVNPGGTRTNMRAAAYPTEDPATVPLPEFHVDLLLYLLAANPADAGFPASGAALDSRTWHAAD